LADPFGLAPDPGGILRRSIAFIAPLAPEINPFLGRTGHAPGALSRINRIATERRLLFVGARRNSL
jgi:hypothetical protein